MITSSRPYWCPFCFISIAACPFFRELWKKFLGFRSGFWLHSSIPTLPFSISLSKRSRDHSSAPGDSASTESSPSPARLSMVPSSEKQADSGFHPDVLGTSGWKRFSEPALYLEPPTYCWSLRMGAILRNYTVALTWSYLKLISISSLRKFFIFTLRELRVQFLTAVFLLDSFCIVLTHFKTFSNIALKV